MLASHGRHFSVNLSFVFFFNSKLKIFAAVTLNQTHVNGNLERLEGFGYF